MVVKVLAGIALIVATYWGITRLWLFGPRDEDGKK